jgi:hypothetical protein
MIIRVNDIDVKSKKECLNTRKTNKSICINDNYILKKSDKITFICSHCGKESHQLFRFKEKFFSNEILCEKCDRSLNNVFKRTDIKEKIKKTNVEKYGVENPMQNNEILNKAQSKQRKNNNGVLAFNSEKQKQTLKERYGNKVIFKTKYFKEKSKQTLFQNYGIINVMENTDNNIIRKKIEKTNLERYGSSFFVNTDDFYNKVDYTGESKQHSELIAFIKSFNINNIKTNVRNIIKPKELDIYLPDHSIAIEFDGLYWHSDRFKDKFYHINKTKDCEEKGIRLIHIFEDEWLEKKEIVESRLKNLLGLNSRRVGARKTIIKEITPKDKNLFLDTYHIQGKDNSNVKLGAFHEDELIGVMTFAKPRVFMGKKAVEGTWELTRFATVADTYTPGLASKMLKYFERGWSPKVIESFADRRWSRGNLYKQLGFDLVSETQPNYFYFKDNKKRYHRYKFRKSELKGFENYSPDKTEKQIMDEAGWFRIYDCGNYKFIKEY